MRCDCNCETSGGSNVLRADGGNCKTTLRSKLHSRRWLEMMGVDKAR